MSEKQQYTKEYLFEHTDGGLLIFERFIPGAEQYARQRKLFKLRANEKTASASIYLDKSDQVYKLKDHGSGDKAMNAVDFVMSELGKTFIETLIYLYQEFNLAVRTLEQFRAKRSTKTTKREIGEFTVNTTDLGTQLHKIAPFLNLKTALDYDFWQVSSYEYVSYKKDEKGNPTNQRILNIVESTDDYPIFCFQISKDCYKIYEPFNDKAYRFRFFGKKPERIVYGWDRLFELLPVKFETLEATYHESQFGDTAAAKRKAKEELDKHQLPAVFIASGGSDGLNLASLGYPVIWFNSESEQINAKEFKTLKIIAKNIYNVPDIDATGVKQAVSLGLSFINIKTVWLPKEMLIQKRKDFRDWINIHKNHGFEVVKTRFENLVTSALQFKFWKWHEKTGSYKYVYDSLLYFLQHNGFYVYRIHHTGTAIGNIQNLFIRVKQNIVSEVCPSDIKQFVIDWLREKNISREVINMVIPSNFLNEKQLLSLPIADIDFHDSNWKEQFYFFKNRIAKITSDGVELIKPTDTDSRIWESAVIDQNISLGEKQFDVSKDEHGNWDIKILTEKSHFLNYLINVSRIHWRNDLEVPFSKDSSTARKEKYHADNRFNIAGKNLSENEVYEQKMHLINKIYSIGYLLHTYKDPSRPWAVYAMDNKLPEITYESHGGSGKSFCISSLLPIIKSRKYIKGRDPEITKQQFIYDGVDENTRLIFIDDAHYSLNLNFFFSELSGSMNINGKFSRAFEIPFRKSPKFAITTNFAPRDLDPSTMRRLLIMVFSDYYHEKKYGDYLETRKITDDFDGRQLFDENFSDADWNLFYNFCLQALSFYLSCKERVDAPQEGIAKRNLMQTMTDSFYDFAKSYFDEFVFNKWIPRRRIQEEFNKYNPKHKLSPQKQKAALEAFCEFCGYKLLVDKQKLSLEEYSELRITANSAVEVYMIATTDQQPAPAASTTQEPASDDLETDLAF